MSTVFKLLGSSTSNSTVEEEVNRIVNLEKEFKNVGIILCVIDQFPTFCVTYCLLLKDPNQLII